MAKESKEIRITNVPTKVRQDLKAIARNMGVDLGQFLKIKLQEIRDSYDDEMKKIKA